MTHDQALAPEPVRPDVDQALYELAEGFHSPSSLEDAWGRSMLAYLVSCGWAGEADADDHFAPTQLDRRLPGEGVMTLTDDGWAEYTRIHG
jgi:hypothetical protein